jgi:DNA-binding YbaB/EbfC family protein
VGQAFNLPMPYKEPAGSKACSTAYWQSDEGDAFVFKGLGNLAEMMKQVGRMRGEIERIGEELKKMVFEGSAGGDMVKVRVNGKQEVLEFRIDPQLFAAQDAEMLEDLLVAATNQALDKARAAAAEQFAKVTGGVGIPGLTDALNQLKGSNS